MHVESLKPAYRFTDITQMADLKENIENEIHSAHDEFLKMDSHIKLYITEMEQSI